VWLSYDGSQLILEWDTSVVATSTLPSLPGLSLAVATYSLEFDLLQELGERPDAAMLVGVPIADRSTEALVLLPTAQRREIWPRVRDLSTAEARMYVAELANAPEKAIELLGVALPSRLLSIGFPLVLFFLSIHFSVYVRLVLRLVDDGVSQLPWIVVLPAIGARAFSAALLLALPVATWVAATFAETSEPLGLRIISGMIGLAAVVIVGCHALVLGYPWARALLMTAGGDRLQAS
jgi:hypothetical protein